jgi:hypothetical protein
MTLQDVSLLAQVFGVLLVSGSLIFVGLQMRQTHAVERANAQRHLLTQWQEWQNSLALDESVFADVRDCMHDYSGSTVFKRQRFFAWAFFALWICEQALYQSQEGLINKVSFDRMIGCMVSIIIMPGGAQWWEEARQLVGADISAYLNRQLAGGPESLPPPFHEMATHYGLEMQGARS